MLTRQEMEARTGETLAPYAMHSSNSRGRAFPEEEHPYRSAYQRDRERIIHSTAFRRLEYKTQVFVNHEGDHYRTRLTHTMEVAQIARAIARVLNLHEDLVEAIALAHDLGHTPFGHSGEDALRKLMKDHGGFEHNTHGLRVVDLLENRYPDFPGLNLTWEVREAIAKHTSAYDHPRVQEFNPELRPLLEGQVVDMADSIAYVSHDLDDGLSAGILSEKVYSETAVLQSIREQVNQRHNHLTAHQRRCEIVRALINLLVTDLCRTTIERIETLAIDSPDAARQAPEYVVALSDEAAALKKELSGYLFKHVYRYYRVVRMTTKAEHFISELFHTYTERPSQLPPYYQDWVRKQGKFQGVCDYIAGMTDRYAQNEYQRLFAPFEHV